MGLAACEANVPAKTPEEIELANIRAKNIVPRTSPAQLVDTFEAVCLSTSMEAARAKLRRFDYAKAPDARGTGIETYFVDTRRPAVQLRIAKGGFDCTVYAQARTGQAARVDDYVAANAPAAQPRAMAGFERFWLAPQLGGIVFTKRVGTRVGAPRQYMFGILRPANTNAAGGGS